MVDARTERKSTYPIAMPYRPPERPPVIGSPLAAASGAGIRLCSFPMSFQHGIKQITASKTP